MSSLSIVISSYKRHIQLGRTLYSISYQTRRPDQIVVVEDGHDDQTEGVCAVARMRHGLNIDYYERRNRPKLGYSNPAIPKNIGIRKATGEILIIQCAEVMYNDREDIAKLVAPVERDPMVSSIATVKALDRNDCFLQWYAGPGRAEKWFLDFCQAIRRQHVVDLGGFDESFRGYGFDDDQFALRMQTAGIKYQWALDVVCSHLWHEIPDKDVELSEWGRAWYNRTKEDLAAGKITPVVNGGPTGPWGDMRS